MRVRPLTADAIHDQLVVLRDMIPGALGVELGLTSAHHGYRLWVKLDDEHTIKAKTVKWSMWPGGASLGSGDTAGEAIDSARENAKRLRDYLLPPTCPECGHVLTKRAA